MKRLAHYSQHFLRSPRLVLELIGHTSIGSNDIVYDVGAGSGVVTSMLAKRCKKVVAVEFEPQTVKKLRNNTHNLANVDIYEGDFLAMELPKTPYKIFANIPFHLSSPIVKKLTEAPHPPSAIYLIVQKQFARKLLPDSERFTSQLGMSTGPWFAVRIRRPLRRTDFWPHPNVDTVLLEIIPRQTPLISNRQQVAYQTFITQCFSTPSIFSKMPLNMINVPPGIKPSHLTLDQWVTLFRSRLAK